MKKAYSNLANVIKLSELDNGALATWDFPAKTDYDGVNSEFYKKYIQPYLNVAGKYGKKTPEKVDYPIYNIDGGTAIDIYAWQVLPDGTSITVFTSVGDIYYWIFVDLNASNKPNRLGKDIFMFDIRAGKFMFWWQNMPINILKEEYYACKKGTGKQYAGGACGALIIRNAWEIPDDYPL